MRYGGKGDQRTMIIWSAGTNQEYFWSLHYVSLVFTIRSYLSWRLVQFDKNQRAIIAIDSTCCACCSWLELCVTSHVERVSNGSDWLAFIENDLMFHLNGDVGNFTIMVRILFPPCTKATKPDGISISCLTLRYITEKTQLIQTEGINSQGHIIEAYATFLLDSPRLFSTLHHYKLCRWPASDPLSLLWLKHT